MIKQIAKKLALRKPSPYEITLSMPGAKDNDFYSVFIDIPDIGYNLLCKSENEDCLEGFLWINNTDGSKASVLKDTLKNNKWTVNFTHYYKGWTHEYSSAPSFLFNTLIQKHRFVRKKNSIAQALFNRKKLVRAERIQLLQYIFDKTSENSNYSISPGSVGTELYSRRWYRHPDQQKTRNYYKMLLESLHESGDLNKNGSAYKLSPKALSSLSEFAREEQRHSDNQNSAKKTRSLTIAIIILGTLNLGFQIVKWLLEKQQP